VIEMPWLQPMRSRISTESPCIFRHEARGNDFFLVHDFPWLLLWHSYTLVPAIDGPISSFHFKKALAALGISRGTPRSVIVIPNADAVLLALILKRKLALTAPVSFNDRRLAMVPPRSRSFFYVVVHVALAKSGRRKKSKVGSAVTMH